MNQTLSPAVLGNETLKTVHRLRTKNGASLNAQRQFQKKKADAQNPVDQEGWFNSMKIVFEEIDVAFQFIPPDRPQRFLDIGCCPGGFSSYILERYPHCSGLGISLPIEMGGHGFLLEEYLKPRFELVWADVTRYNLGPDSMPNQDPFTDTYDIILVDGHPLRRDSSEDVHLHGDRLLISQLIIALKSIHTATNTATTTAVVKLSKPERVITAQLMYMFDIISTKVGTWKPVYMHATRSTFYLVARGVGDGPQGALIGLFLQHFRKLWQELMYGGRGRTGRRLREDDLGFIVSKDELQTTYSPRLQQLSQHIWAVEAESLRGWYANEGY